MQTKMPRSSWAKFGWVAGVPLRYIHGHNKVRLGTDRWILIPESGCHRWYGALTGAGYGAMRVNGRMVLAHIWFYNQAHPDTPVPMDQELDHLCHTHDPLCPGGNTCLHRRCVYAEHLEPVSHEENMHRGVGTRLTRAEADVIRASKGTRRAADLAAQYGVSVGMVYSIWRGDSWKEEWARE